MNEPPGDVTDAEVLAAVRRHWAPEVDAVAHLPVGFGAHHWAASTGGRPALFVTLDLLGRRHDLASLDATYAAVAELGLDFAHAGRAPWAVALGDRALSVTPWLDGVRPASLDPVATGELLTRLHAVARPAGLRGWRPLVGPGLADDLADRVRRPWDAGPYGERARAAITERLGAIEGWVASYHRLGEVAHTLPWVATHGEPGRHNQLLVEGGLRLVDWESLLLAPPERDLRTVGAGDPAMLEMFALEWRLDEVSQYAGRFEAAHLSGADDQEALGGLLEELRA